MNTTRALNRATDVIRASFNYKQHSSLSSETKLIRKYLFGIRKFNINLNTTYALSANSRIQIKKVHDIQAAR